MIYLENLSSEEREAIEELRKRMKHALPASIYKDTLLLYRFLKARDFHLEKAEIMLRKHVSWRKHFQVDTFLQDFTPKTVFEKCIQFSHLGLDKSGNMVEYIPLGKLDIREIINCFYINEYMKHWIWNFEKITAHARKLNNKPDRGIQMTAILNLDKLTIGNATNKTAVEVCVRGMHLLQDNYPEVLNAVYVINSPSYYIFVFSILKTMMSSAMIQKYKIYGRSGWQEKLLEVIDADVLPAFLGGNRTDPDGNPLCTTFVSQGGKIPEEYYLPEEERDFKDRSLVKRITIRSREKKEIFVHVPEPGSQIHWEFLIKNKDIGFGLFLKMSESKFKEILPIERYDTTDGVEKGIYKSQSDGEYIIVFDNSYSWMNSKEVEYCITIVQPVS